MTYLLFLDDERTIDMVDTSYWPKEFQNGIHVKIARSSSEALELIKNSLPAFMSLDHDLGGEDTTMVFLKTWVAVVWDGKTPPPDYYVHSANPVGKQNIVSYLETWKKICV